jgi:ubiquitin carboxyl-terminal hydrolase L5
MDMLNSDLQLKNDATAKKSKSIKKNNEAADESEAGYHFIAFVPALGRLWKFDGLERQPQNLGRLRYPRVHPSTDHGSNII